MQPSSAAKLAQDSRDSSHHPQVRKLRILKTEELAYFNGHSGSSFGPILYHPVCSHITFDCLHHRRQRQELIGNIKTWEELDTPLWKKEEAEEKEWDAAEAYFAYLYRTLAGR
ncbi:hypothetical protein EV426DRAFT_703378 [Tirmania nivea]|nr:hypothetical protein EV426DRAFT_703378 [Tirmania nivea]